LRKREKKAKRVFISSKVKGDKETSQLFCIGDESESERKKESERRKRC
jgi:hypothetical protein